MMKKCPKCKHHSVAFDAYRKINRCMIDGCSCIVNTDSSFSFLRHDFTAGVVDRVQIKDEKETVIKTYNFKSLGGK